VEDGVVRSFANGVVVIIFGWGGEAVDGVGEVRIIVGEDRREFRTDVICGFLTIEGMFIVAGGGKSAEGGCAPRTRLAMTG